MTSTTTPSTGELVDGLSFFPIALVVSATIFPGLTLCIPGLILAAAFILIPLAALAIVVLAVAAVFAAPVLLVRGIRRLATSETVDEVEPAPIVTSPFAAAAVHRLTAGPPLHQR
jgi:hypothetical protein